MDRCNRSSQWKLQVIYHDDYSYFTGAGSLVLDTRVPVNVSQDGAMGGALTPVRIATLLLVPPVLHCSTRTSSCTTSSAQAASSRQHISNKRARPSQDCLRFS